MTRKEVFEKEYKMYLLYQFIGVTAGITSAALLVNNKKEIESKDAITSNCFDIFTIENDNEIYSVSMKFYINRNLTEGYLKINEVYSFVDSLDIDDKEIYTIQLDNVEEDISKVADKILELVKEKIQNIPDKELGSDFKISFMDYEDFSHYLNFKVPPMRKHNLLIDASMSLGTELDKEENKNLPFFEHIFEYDNIYMGFSGSNNFTFSDGTSFWYSTEADNLIIDYIENKNEDIEDSRSAYGWNLMEE